MARAPGSAANATHLTSMADVAARAGVSPQTVSRVLSESPRVAPATRERVLAAVAELDYHPNLAARTMAAGRTRTLGLISLEIPDLSRAVTANALELAAHDLGYEVGSVGVRTTRVAELYAAIRRLRAQRVEGVLLAVPIVEEDRDSALTLPRVPMVALDARPDPAVDLIAYDQVAAGRMATGHLLGLGHPTVWHVAGPESWSDSRSRTAGWRDALTRAGAHIPPVLHGDWSPGSGYALAAQLPADATAVFVASDDMAIGLLAGLRSLGRTVTEVSVVGIDDSPMSPYAVPSLTTVRMDLSAQARQAVAHLVSVIDDGDHDHTAPLTTLLEPKLVVRESSRPR